MNKKLIFKISVDVAMTGVLLFLMSYSMIGDLTHEILGTSMLVLLIIHHILNLQWHKNLFKGKYTAFRTAQTALSALVLLSVLGSAVSGVMMSRHVFRFLNITVGASFARTLHMICAYWGFALMSMHLGFHWQMMMSMAGKLFKQKSRVREWIVRILGFASAGYGFYAMFRRSYFDYLLLKNQFVFFDPNENVLLFVLDYAAIMSVFVLVGHYLAKLLKIPGRKSAKTE